MATWISPPTSLARRRRTMGSSAMEEAGNPRRAAVVNCGGGERSRESCARQGESVFLSSSLSLVDADDLELGQPWRRSRAQSDVPGVSWSIGEGRGRKGDAMQAKKIENQTPKLLPH